MGTVIILLYAVWALYAGLRVMKGRIPWCEEPKLPNRVVKIVVSFLIGSAIGAFYLVFLIFMLLFGSTIRSERRG